MRELAIQIFYSALRAVDPFMLVSHYADQIRVEYKRGGYKNFIVVGAGKAAYHMAKGAEEALYDLINYGVVITKYGHACLPSLCSGISRQGGKLNKIKIIEAGHPMPDINGVRGTEEVIKVLEHLNKDTLVLCLISGGGSALWVSPATGITLEDKKEITRLLLNSGADIEALNTVRKHISNVKGGRLAEVAYPAKVFSFMLSDVIGDRLDIIASGPTVPDNTSYKDAFEVLKKFKLIERAPLRVLELIKRGINGIIPETLKEDNPIFNRVKNMVVGSNERALIAARDKANALGLSAHIISSKIKGEARKVARYLSSLAVNIKDTKGLPQCLISGGETQVTVKGKGMGGRNMELALVFALAIEGMGDITLLSAGTDGTDGPTDAAGAIVDGNTVPEARALGLAPEAYLENNDSYNFFKKTGGLFVTGPTGTNVMDIQIIIRHTEQKFD